MMEVIYQTYKDAFSWKNSKQLRSRDIAKWERTKGMYKGVHVK